jgi:hypothetical protein
MRSPFFFLIVAVAACGDSSGEVISTADGGGGGGNLLSDAQPVDCTNGPNFTGCPCAVGDVRNCYTGPSGTEGVGRCLGGTQTCVSQSELNAVFGPCMGEVVPSNTEGCTETTDSGSQDGAAATACMTNADCVGLPPVPRPYWCVFPSNGGCEAQGRCIEFDGSAICESGPPYVCDCAGKTVSLASLTCGVGEDGYLTTPIQSATAGPCADASGE